VRLILSKKQLNLWTYYKGGRSIKGRDDCWKSDDKKKCVQESYTRRIAELEARYMLVSSKGPFFYNCDGVQSKVVVITFFETEPPTLIAEYGDSVSLMYLQPSGSGAKYQGRNESVWIKGNEAMITWGYDTPEMSCQQKP
jgi:membrane-bound inhibitor of C-type lysozyme